MRHVPLFVLLAATLLVAGSIGAARAGEPAKESGPKVDILAIHASKQEKPHCDPALASIKDALTRSGYNAFRLLSRDTRPAQIGKPLERTLADPYAIAVQIQEINDENVKLVLSWIEYTKDDEGKAKKTERQRLPMTLRLGKYFLSGGWKLKDGALLAAVAVQ